MEKDEDVRVLPCGHELGVSIGWMMWGFLHLIFLSLWLFLWGNLALEAFLGACFVLASYANPNKLFVRVPAVCLGRWLCFSDLVMCELVVKVGEFRGMF